MDTLLDYIKFQKLEVLKLEEKKRNFCFIIKCFNTQNALKIGTLKGYVSFSLFIFGTPFYFTLQSNFLRFKIRWLEHFSLFEVLLIRLQSPLCKARILKNLGSFLLFLGHLAGFFVCAIHRWCGGWHLDPKYLIRI